MYIELLIINIDIDLPFFGIGACSLSPGSLSPFWFKLARYSADDIIQPCYTQTHSDTIHWIQYLYGSLWDLLEQCSLYI